MNIAAVVACTAASVVWLLAFVLGARSGSVYLPLGSTAIVVTVVALWRAPALRAQLRPSARDVGVGVAVGAALLVATHVGFHVLLAYLPAFGAAVTRLYAIAAVTPAVLVGVLAIVVAEEVLWRGALPTALAPVLSPRAAGALSTVAYAAAQLGAGSVLLGAAALGLGAVWMVLAHLTRGLVAPLLSHAIWTIGVLGVWRLG